MFFLLFARRTYRNWGETAARRQAGAALLVLVAAVEELLAAKELAHGCGGDGGGLSGRRQHQHAC